MNDHLQPLQPAKMIHDAFQKEVKKRDGRSMEEWIAAERQVMWLVARSWSLLYGYSVLSLEDIEEAENYGLGHVDYGAKVAYKIAEKILKRE